MAQDQQEVAPSSETHDAKRRSILIGGGASALLGAFAPMRLSAQDNAWPSRPVRIIQATAPGGSIGAMARAYGDFITQRTGASVIVEPKPGGNSMIAADLVARSPADGHTLLFVVNSALTQAPILLKQTPLPDPANAFDMIAGFSPGPALFVIKSGLAVKNLREFVALARRQRIILGSIGAGSRAHLVGEQMNKLLGTQIDVIHYKGAGPALLALAAGEIDCSVGSYTGSRPHLESGRIRTIAITSGARTPKMPEVPTFAEEGFTQPSFRLRDWLTLAAPRGTPRATLERIGAFIREGAATPSVMKAQEASAVSEAPLVLAEFEKALSEERPVWQNATRELGLTPG